MSNFSVASITNISLKIVKTLISPNAVKNRAKNSGVKVNCVLNEKSKMNIGVLIKWYNKQIMDCKFEF